MGLMGLLVAGDEAGLGWTSDEARLACGLCLESPDKHVSKRARREKE